MAIGILFGIIASVVSYLINPSDINGAIFWGLIIGFFAWVKIPEWIGPKIPFNRKLWQEHHHQKLLPLEIGSKQVYLIITWGDGETINYTYFTQGDHGLVSNSINNTKRNLVVESDDHRAEVVPLSVSYDPPWLRYFARDNTRFEDIYVPKDTIVCNSRGALMSGTDREMRSRTLSATSS